MTGSISNSLKTRKAGPALITVRAAGDLDEIGEIESRRITSPREQQNIS